MSAKNLPTDWHRLHGLGWIDLLRDEPFFVELEKDLSIQQQLLDVLIVRKDKGRSHLRLPDGFDNLKTHNLITFKSFQEALDDWALKELTGYYVAYRKLASPSRQALLSEDEFGLYAVCSRFPHNLANTLTFQQIQDGVYQVERGTDLIRVIVLGQLPKREHNAMLHLLSADRELVKYGAEHYQQRSADSSRLLWQFLEGYGREGVTMSYTKEDYLRDYAGDHEDFLRDRIGEFILRERLKGLSAQEILEMLPVDQLLKALPAEKIEKHLKERQKNKSPRKRKKST